jgi:pimeloyl-ACP methyl ester carboxylesterase
MKQLACIVVLVCVLSFFCSSCAGWVAEPVDELVDIGTHSLHITCQGVGGPTIVIDTGAGDTFARWMPLMDSLSENNRVCAYDRAGYGQSDHGPMPRTSRVAVEELHLLLINTGESAPFLLLGHSLGALNMQVYAVTYPDDIVGMVLLDPPPFGWLVGENYPDLRELFKREVGSLIRQATKVVASGNPEDQNLAKFLSAVASEQEQMFVESAQQVSGIDSFGQLPLVVVGATQADPRFGESSESFRQYWNYESQKIVQKSENGRFVIAEGSTHQIHLDSPNLVLQEIDAMLLEIRE